MASKHDAALDAIYKQQTGLGADVAFLDAVFGFLRRKTDVMARENAAQRIKRIAERHCVVAAKAAAAAKTAAAAAKAAEEAAAVPVAAASGKAAAAAATGAVIEEIDDDDDGIETIPDAKNENDGDDGDDDAAAKVAPAGNGGATDAYVWTQTLGTVEVSVPVAKATRARDLIVDVDSSPTAFSIGFKSGAGAGDDNNDLLSGAWPHAVDTQNATWTLEDMPSDTTPAHADGGGRYLVLYLPKQNKMQWWNCARKGDATIDTSAVVPENSKLGDLDGDTRATVEKMMFDQAQKQKGLPSSDEQKKQEMLQKFMSQHPEMDFSHVKMM
jgi:hypothetical protein